MRNLAACLAVLVLVALPTQAPAVGLQNGDVVSLVDYSECTGFTIVRVNPLSGDRVTISGPDPGNGCTVIGEGPEISAPLA